MAQGVDGALRWPVAVARALAAAALLGGCAAAFAAPPVAMVTDLGGDVRTGEERKLAILDTLAEGEELRVATGARVVLVYLGAGTEHAFAGPARLRLGAAAPEVASGSAGTQRELSLARETGLVQAGGGGLGQAAIVMRGGPKAKRLMLLSPSGTVLSPRPVFRWRAPEAGLRYRFRLLDEGGRVVVEETVSELRFELPAGRRLEDDVFYTWEVATTLADGVEVAGEGDVSLLPAAERERIAALRPAQGADVSERVLWALLLEREGLADDARAEWARLEAERPGDTGLAAKLRQRQ